MIKLTPQQQGIVNSALAILSASGPIVALLLVKQGVDPTTINILSTWATAVLPTILSVVVAMIIHSPESVAKSAGTIPGTMVNVDEKVASSGMIAIAKDENVAGVEIKKP